MAVSATSVVASIPAGLCLKDGEIALANRKFYSALEAALAPGETIVKQSDCAMGPKKVVLALTQDRLVIVKGQLVPPRPTVSDLPLRHVIAARCDPALGNTELWIESRAGDFRFTFTMGHRKEAQSWPLAILNAQEDAMG